jgi:hypothetical protein
VRALSREGLAVVDVWDAGNFSTDALGVRGVAGEFVEERYGGRRGGFAACYTGEDAVACEPGAALGICSLVLCSARGAKQIVCEVRGWP